MPVQIPNRFKAYVFLTLAVMIWGIATPVIKATVEYVPPFSFLAIRFWISCIIALPMSIYYLSKVKLNKTRTRYLLTASFIGHIAALSLYFTGLNRTGSVEASLISSLAPLVVAVMGFFILKEIIKRKQIEGILIAFLGTLIIVFEPLPKIALFGNLLFVSGMIFDSFYSIYVKKYLAEDKVITAFMQISLSFVFAAIVFTPLAVIEQYGYYNKSTELSQQECTIADIDKFQNNSGVLCDNVGCHTIKNPEYYCMIAQEHENFAQFTTTNIQKYLSQSTKYGIIYMALISGLLGYVLYVMGLKYIEASEAAVFYYLQPLFGVPIAIIFLKESITSIFIIGAILVAFGIILAERKK